MQHNELEIKLFLQFSAMRRYLEEGGSVVMMLVKEGKANFLNKY